MALLHLRIYKISGKVVLIIGEAIGYQDAPTKACSKEISKKF